MKTTLSKLYVNSKDTNIIYILAHILVDELIMCNKYSVTRLSTLGSKSMDFLALNDSLWIPRTLGINVTWHEVKHSNVTRYQPLVGRTLPQQGVWHCCFLVVWKCSSLRMGLRSNHAHRYTMVPTATYSSAVVISSWIQLKLTECTLIKFVSWDSPN